MPTRLTSRPRTIGRLDAPGAKLDPVTPGLLKSRSPNVELPLRLISSLGTTVTVANWSVTTGNVPFAGTAGAGGAAAAAGAAGLATCFGCAGAGRRIGLGACPPTGGISTCAKTSLMLNDRHVVLPRSSAWFSLIDMVIPQHRIRVAALETLRPTERRHCFAQRSDASGAVDVRRWEARGPGTGAAVMRRAHARAELRTAWTRREPAAVAKLLPPAPPRRPFGSACRLRSCRGSGEALSVATIHQAAWLRPLRPAELMLPRRCAGAGAQTSARAGAP